MPQPANRKVFNLSRGLVTESPVLQFPEDSTVDEENFTIANDGSRRRRLGVEFEASYQQTDSLVGLNALNQDVVSTHYWRDVDDDATTDFIVIQTGEILHFYEDNDVLSANKKSFTFDLTEMAAPGASTSDVSESRISATAVRGELLITGKYVKSFVLQYDEATDALGAAPVTIRARDFKGVNDGLEVDTEPTLFTNAHKYNLYNQGWNSDDWDQYFTDKGVYPSNAMLSQFFYRLTRDESTSSNVIESEEFNSEYGALQVWGSTWAPRGRVIENVFNTAQTIVFAGSQFDISSWSYNDSTNRVTITTSAAHGLTQPSDITVSGNYFSYEKTSGGEPIIESLDGDYTTTAVPSTTTLEISYTIPGWTGTSSFINKYIQKGVVGEDTGSTAVTNPSGRVVDVRPEFVEFYQGRAVWAGIADKELSKRIFCSQVIERDDQYGKCYQDADPTSEYVSDPIASDGLVVVIPEVGKITGLSTQGAALLVFADNGVWEVSPPRDNVFGPLGYRTRKITDVPCIGPDTIVKAEDLTFFASGEGLYVFRPDERTGVLFAQSISQSTIQSLVRDIPDSEKARMQGTYDPVNKRVIWMYNTAPLTAYKFGYQLNFDLRFRAFTRYQFPQSSVYIAGILAREIYDDDVKTIKYVTVLDTAQDITFSELRDTNFVDWQTFKDANPGATGVGVDADGYLITGHDNLGEPALQRSGGYLLSFFERTETSFVADGSGNTVFDAPSGCDLTARWEWADSDSSNKAADHDDVYRINTAFVAGDPGDPITLPEVIASKTSLRGAGRALQLKYKTKPNTDCRFLGWQMILPVNDRP